MEEDSYAADGGKSESEDFPLSDTENATPGDDDDDDDDIPLTIDYNARVVSGINEKFEDDDGDDCDMHFVHKDSNFCRRGSENRLQTSTEDLSVSEDEEKAYKALTLQSVDLDGIACIAGKVDANTLSTLNYSHTGFKDEYSTDAEIMSDEETSNNAEENFYAFDKNRQLPPGLTFGALSANNGSSAAFPESPRTLKSLNIKNAYSKSLLISENNLQELYDEQESPLMTCLEFLKSEYGEDCDTDAEDLSIGSLDEMPTHNRYSIGDGCSEFSIPIPISALSENSCHSGVLHPGDSRRSSTAGFHTEDETFNLENFSNVGRKRLKRRTFLLVDKTELSDDTPTDEEDFDMRKKEWTETDDSGGVRQITQIKTETSIKLEGEGDDLGMDSDDIISRTTTTTTRIVTTVTTDGEQESHEDQHILGDGDDLRHSVEVILNQFMSSDSDATKPEDSTTEHDE